jgi:hypothetical protein
MWRGPEIFDTPALFVSVDAHGRALILTESERTEARYYVQEDEMGQVYT